MQSTAIKLYSDKSSQNSNEIHVHVFLMHANVYIFPIVTGSYVSDDHIVPTHSSASYLFILFSSSCTFNIKRN